MAVNKTTAIYMGNTSDEINIRVYVWPLANFLKNRKKHKINIKK